MIISDHQINLLQASYTSIWLGSCSSDYIPDMVRLSGARVAEDKLHLNLYVPQLYTHTFFKNVQENAKISFLCSSTLSFEAYQIKGLYLDWRPCTSEEVDYQQQYLNGFAKNLEDFGLRSGFNFVNYYKEPGIAIRMRSEEMYEQTPKSGTGNKIS